MPHSFDNRNTSTATSMLKACRSARSLPAACPCAAPGLAPARGSHSPAGTRRCCRARPRTCAAGRNDQLKNTAGGTKAQSNGTPASVHVQASKQSGGKRCNAKSRRNGYENRQPGSCSSNKLWQQLTGRLPPALKSPASCQSCRPGRRAPRRAGAPAGHNIAHSGVNDEFNQQCEQVM